MWQTQHKTYHDSVESHPQKMVILGMVAAEDLLGRDPGVVSGMHAPHPPFKVVEAVDW